MLTYWAKAEIVTSIDFINNGPEKLTASKLQQKGRRFEPSSLVWNNFSEPYDTHTILGHLYIILMIQSFPLLFYLLFYVSSVSKIIRSLIPFYQVHVAPNLYKTFTERFQ